MAKNLSFCTLPREAFDKSKLVPRRRSVYSRAGLPENGKTLRRKSPERPLSFESKEHPLSLNERRYTDATELDPCESAAPEASFTEASVSLSPAESASEEDYSENANNLFFEWNHHLLGIKWLLVLARSGCVPRGEGP